MQSVKPPVEAPISTQARPEREMDQWARARSSLRPPRLTYFRSEPRRRMTDSTGGGVPGLSMRCPSTRTRPARMRAWARSREAACPWSTRSLSSRTFSTRDFTGLGIRWIEESYGCKIGTNSFIAPHHGTGCTHYGGLHRVRGFGVEWQRDGLGVFDR